MFMNLVMVKVMLTHGLLVVLGARAFGEVNFARATPWV